MYLFCSHYESFLRLSKNREQTIFHRLCVRLGYPTFVINLVLLRKSLTIEGYYRKSCVCSINAEYSFLGIY